MQQPQPVKLTVSAQAPRCMGMSESAGERYPDMSTVNR